MKTLRYINIMLVLLCMANSSFAEGERFLGKQVNYTNPALDASFAYYDVFQMDINAINAYAKSFGDEPFELTLVMDNQYFWDLSLMSYEIRSEDYTLRTATDHGDVIVPRRQCITYTGITNNSDGRDIRMSITDYGIMGYVYVNDEEVFIEPAARLVEGAPANYFITYKAHEILVDPEITCGKDLMDQHSAPIEKNLGLQEDNRSSAGIFCEEVEFALAAAYDMYTAYGFNVQNVEDHLLTITAMMEPLYDDFDLDYRVKTIFVPTTSGSDPFPTTADVDVILPFFETWGNSGNFGTIHDLGQLWVDRNIFGCGSGTGLIGCSNIGSVCDPDRYNVCEDWSASFSCLRALSAHENGHNWDGVHSQAPTSSQIMWPTIGCSNTTWGSGNITRMNNHINSRTCIVPCATACPGAYFLVDFIESGTWKYEASVWIISEGEITASATVIYDAASYIELREGFLADPTTGSFVARNDGCGGILANPADNSQPNAKAAIAEVDELTHLDFKAYPNPFNDQLTLEYRMEEATDVTILLFNSVGKELMRAVDEADIKEDYNYVKTLNVSNIAAGAYYVTIIAGDEQMVKKVIKLD